MILTKTAKFGKMTKSDILAVKNMTEIAIKILQGSAVTQNVLGGLVIQPFLANFLPGGPKKRYPGFNFAITSVNVHRF